MNGGCESGFPRLKHYNNAKQFDTSEITTTPLQMSTTTQQFLNQNIYLLCLSNKLKSFVIERRLCRGDNIERSTRTVAVERLKIVTNSG